MRKIDLVKGSLSISRTGINLRGVGENGEYINLYIGIIPEIETKGVCSRTEDDYHVLFMDFDDIDYKILQSHLQRLAKHYNLSHFLILKTSNSHYHAICFEKFTKKEIEQILADSYVDVAYRHPNIASTDNGWVLRISSKYLQTNNGIKVVKQKPEVVDFLVFGEPRRRLSTAHWNLYKKLFKPKKMKEYEEMLKRLNRFTYWDGLFTVELINYKTTHRNLNMFEKELLGKRINIKVTI